LTLLEDTIVWPYRRIPASRARLRAARSSLRRRVAAPCKSLEGRVLLAYSLTSLAQVYAPSGDYTQGVVAIDASVVVAATASTTIFCTAPGFLDTSVRVIDRPLRCYR
jgi:hypothetical protein